jgi:hypothetical protein
LHFSSFLLSKPIVSGPTRNAETIYQQLTVMPNLHNTLCPLFRIFTPMENCFATLSYAARVQKYGSTTSAYIFMIPATFLLFFTSKEIPSAAPVCEKG